MTEFQKQLIESGKKFPKEYGQKYVDNFNQIYNFIQNYNGLKSDIFLRDTTKELNKIRFCAVFSDLTSIYFKELNKEEGQIIIQEPDKIKENFKITIPNTLLKELKEDNGKLIIHPGFLVRNERDINKSINLLEPLLESQRAILHNIRTVVCLSNKRPPIPKPDGTENKVWTVYTVSPESPEGHWFVSENSSQTESLPISFNPTQLIDKQEIFNLTIPYLQNIPLSELVKILNDNDDVILNFRSGVKELVSQAKSGGKSIEEMRFDIVEPEIEKLRRNFKRIKSMHRIKVGASVGSITLSLLSYSINEFSQIISSFLGAGGLGYMFKSEEEYQKEIERLKDSKLYLLWKIKN
jgi:hypothetical protein